MHSQPLTTHYSLLLTRKGFTLLELLVVIAIIGLLAGIATISFGTARGKARDARRVSEVKQIQTALNLYADNQGDGSMPNGSLLEIGGDSAKCLDNTGFKATGCIPPILIDKINPAPTPADGSCTSGNNKYIYARNLSDVSDYAIEFCLGSSTGGVIAGTHTATRNGIN